MTGPDVVATLPTLASPPTRPGLVGGAGVELRKLLTVRGTFVVAALVLLLSALITGLRLGLPGEDPAVEFPTPDSRLDILGMPIMFNVLFVALGAMLTGAEWRHRTATLTFLVEPRRRRVVATQLGVAALVGTVVAGVSAVVVRGAAAIALTLRDAPTTFGADEWPTMLGVVLAGTLGAVIGAGFGAVLRNPALAAVSVAVGGTMLGLVTGLVSEDLGDAISVQVALGRLVGDEGEGPLQLAGIVTLVGWATLAGAVGTRRTDTADVT